MNILNKIGNNLWKSNSSIYSSLIKKTSVITAKRFEEACLKLILVDSNPQNRAYTERLCSCWAQKLVSEKRLDQEYLKKMVSIFETGRARPDMNPGTPEGAIVSQAGMECAKLMEPTRFGR